MKQETDRLESFFRSRLSDMELPVREGFWETLEQDVSRATGRHRYRLWQRWAVAASVLLVLGGVSAAFWMWLPQKLAAPEPGRPNWIYAGSSIGTDRPALVADVSKSDACCAKSHRKPVQPISKSADEGNDSVVVSWEMSFEYHVREGRNQTGQDVNRAAVCGGRASAYVSSQTDASSEPDDRELEQLKKKWNFKAAVSPVWEPAGSGAGVRVSAERRLNDWLGLEAGLEYDCLSASDEKRHRLSVPVKLNFMLSENAKWDVYASLGCAPGKYVGNSRSAGKDLQWTAMASVGGSYKLNDRLAVFAEPGMTYRLDSHAPKREKAGFTMLCGIRMSY